jgi:hypothetical protein
MQGRAGLGVLSVAREREPVRLAERQGKEALGQGKVVEVSTIYRISLRCNLFIYSWGILFMNDACR